MIEAGREAASASAPTGYRLAAEGLALVALDALTAVYHPASAQTHLVIAPMPAILAQLPCGGEARGMDVAALARRLGLDPDAEVQELLGARLGELRAIGLVEAVSAAGGPV